MANRILAAQGVVDGWGHVSVRHPDRADRFLLARGLAPAIVTRDDLLEMDVVTGEPVDGGHTYLERHIHSGIYRARPDVNAVVHSHAPDMIPFSVTGTDLQPLLHSAAFLGDGAPRFAIDGVLTGVLIDSSAIGDALAASLGAAPLVLMRSHGVSVVGTSLTQAVYRSVYARMNACVQLQSIALGDVTYLSSQESREIATTVDKVLDRLWNLWVRELGDAANLI
ncbi:class II aldolase/adducin family protein [Nocardia jiangxiensis]|uniref:Class II aldolase/adducin family protein n=1 Tax=Nocardia jiangxiensis TaxID=282685 RepID=A0ABW6SE11_9NOCA|nr:class II aldolase/adducin family protein [Nocardia jiangxiensis]